MAETIKIGGELESMATGKVVAAASAIKDKTRGKTQDMINTDVEDALASHTSRIDNTDAKVTINEQEIDSVRDIIRTHEFEQGVVQYADDVYCDVEGLVTANVQAALGELAKMTQAIEEKNDNKSTTGNANYNNIENKVNALIDCLLYVVKNAVFYAGTPYVPPADLETKLNLLRYSLSGTSTTSAVCGQAICGQAICGVN